MKIKKFKQLLGLAVGATLATGAAIAQQAASADFAPKKEAASIAFSTTGSDAANCVPTMPMPSHCGTLSKKKKRHAAKKAAATTASATPMPTDPLAVHPEAAVKDTPQKEINLPGVMKIAGANANVLDFTRARVVDASNEGSQSVYLSATDQNRIQVPWVDPKVVGTTQLDIDKSEKSNNIYVQFKDGVNHPVQIYIERPEGGGAVFGLQLIPKNIPAQTILLRDTSKLADASIKSPRASDYVSQTQAVMETVSMGGVPQGYSQIALKLPPIIMNGLVVTPEKQFSAADRDVFIYDVANPAQTAVTLREQEFDGDSVLAISIFPSPILRLNEHAKVIVIAKKS